MPLLFKVGEAAAELNLPRSTVYELVRLLKIRSIRVPVGTGDHRPIRIPREALAEFIEENTRD